MAAVLIPLGAVFALSAAGIVLCACKRRDETQHKETDAYSGTDSDTDHMEEGAISSSEFGQQLDSTIENSHCVTTVEVSSSPPRVPPLQKSSLIQTLEKLRVDEDHCGPVDIDHGGGAGSFVFTTELLDDECASTCSSRRSDCSSAVGFLIFDDCDDNNSSSSSSSSAASQAVSYYNNQEHGEEAWMEFQHCSSHHEENGSVNDIMDAWKRPGTIIGKPRKVVKKATSRVEL